MKGLLIRMDKELHETIRRISFEKNISMNEIVVNAIKEKLNSKER
ncbi:MAG TPA: hypothetical protein VFC70_01130 [Oscillospiraceae bacterium]|nr:hypothetical protein [Oscillospiraceae bacterium]